MGAVAYVAAPAIIGAVAGYESVTTAAVGAEALCEKYCSDSEGSAPGGYQVGDQLPGNYGTVVKNTISHVKGFSTQHAFNRLVSSGLNWDDVTNIISSPTTLRKSQDEGQTFLHFTPSATIITNNIGLIDTVIPSTSYNSTLQTIVNRL